MGGIQKKISAPTKKELEAQAREFLRPAREQDWDIRWGWDPDAAQKNDEGEWEITLWVHS